MPYIVSGNPSCSLYKQHLNENDKGYCMLREENEQKCKGRIEYYVLLTPKETHMAEENSL